ncbi:phytoene desaturase family protein [Chitinophaga sancti]|uniref:All-trans-retinol 13,14-reductase n=1 Tax=Chitinophaga sancti TaxID=1004 RepID=A0A1K1PW55_9BACT|nr:NAD(P)/FAD-dependent oxidoreductase [Chitinophaga sancti]WQD61578.1 NAD(P)/FAD-dependent oxidoreductase [Chitinophaga sancti]WQG92865.1 NAD(P)/FAD-dependent oxidoreductase [Chitinophaga sancti]SFW51675.1 all-trans-retinol 13,14-reductase [Chitinophaga sancti]
MQQYDVIIIGSGLGSLVCGAILGKYGYRVCLFEKNRQIGGCLQTYSRDKAIIDSGVHYIGGLEEGQTLHKVFRYLGVFNNMKLLRMEIDGFDHISFGNEQHVYKMAQGRENFIQQLVADFPKEKEALHAYVDKLEEVCGKFPLFNMRLGNAAEKESVMGEEVSAFLRSITSNERLQNVLAGNNMLYAGYPDRTPLYVHALVQHSYIESAWKCVDGGSVIARSLSKTIRAQGGDIIRNTEVKSIVESEGKVSHIVLENGQEVGGKYFISGLHPVRTIGMVKGEGLRNAYKSRINSLENTPGTFMINVILKPGTFPYLNHNIYHHATSNAWDGINYTADNWPQTYAMFVSAGTGKEQYADNLSIMTYMRYEDVAQWHDTFNTDDKPHERDASYQEFKKEKAEKLLDMVSQQYPHLRSCIHAMYVATPLTYRDYLNIPEGSMYGIVKDAREPLKSMIPAATRLPNLYLTGQNLNLHGILGVTMSAVLTCASLVDLETIVEEINRS